MGVASKRPSGEQSPLLDHATTNCATALWAILANIGYTPRETHAEVALHSNGAVGVASTLRQAWVLHIAGWRSGRRKT